MDLSLPFCLLGLLSLCWRFRVWQPRLSFQKLATEKKTFVRSVSVIVPCRNERKNLPHLISSLKAVDFPNLEIIIVDDSSEDGTYEVADELLRGFPNYRVIKAPAKPNGWGGKNWPCSIGAREARSEVLLFTDADTVHSPSSVRIAQEFLTTGGYDLISVVPYHRCKDRWEQILGLFLLIPFIATAFKDVAKESRVFAIGQYLMFTKNSYEELGGHQKVASSLAEDIDLSILFLRSGKSYAVLDAPGIYQVQMYANFHRFLIGWKRLLRLGLHRSTLLSFFEVSMVCYLFGFSFLEPKVLSLSIFAAALTSLAIIQRHYGRFSLFGVILAPLSIWLFVLLTIAALFEKAFRKDIQWHGRSYSS